jgi:hypothetical protein
MKNLLPQELICYIIDNFLGLPEYPDWHACEVLRTCSLVCHSWLPLCQRHLFRSIQFSSRTRCRTCVAVLSRSRRLDQVLLNSPHLTGYIRELKLWDGSCDTCEKTWLATADETLPLVLRKLGNLEKIEFQWLYWRKLTTDIKQSLRWVLQLPSITMLKLIGGHFESLDDFFNFIAPARGLTRLALFNIDTSPEEEAPPMSEDQGEFEDELRLDWDKQGRLSHLDLDSTTPLDWLLGPQSIVDLSQVETLCVVAGERAVTVNRVLHSIGGSLKHLQIHLPSSRSPSE